MRVILQQFKHASTRLTSSFVTIVRDHNEGLLSTRISLTSISHLLITTPMVTGMTSIFHRRAFSRTPLLTYIAVLDYCGPYWQISLLTFFMVDTIMTRFP